MANWFNEHNKQGSILGRTQESYGNSSGRTADPAKSVFKLYMVTVHNLWLTGFVSIPIYVKLSTKEAMG